MKLRLPFVSILATGIAAAPTPDMDDRPKLQILSPKATQANDNLDQLTNFQKLIDNVFENTRDGNVHGVCKPDKVPGIMFRVVAKNTSAEVWDVHDITAVGHTVHAPFSSNFYDARFDSENLDTYHHENAVGPRANCKIWGGRRHDGEFFIGGYVDPAVDESTIKPMTFEIVHAFHHTYGDSVPIAIEYCLPADRLQGSPFKHNPCKNWRDTKVVERDEPEMLTATMTREAIEVEFSEEASERCRRKGETGQESSRVGQVFEKVDNADREIRSEEIYDSVENFGEGRECGSEIMFRMVSRQASTDVWDVQRVDAIGYTVRNVFSSNHHFDYPHSNAIGENKNRKIWGGRKLKGEFFIGGYIKPVEQDGSLTPVTFEVAHAFHEDYGHSVAFDIEYCRPGDRVGKEAQDPCRDWQLATVVGQAQDRSPHMCAKTEAIVVKFSEDALEYCREIDTKSGWVDDFLGLFSGDGDHDIGGKVAEANEGSGANVGEKHEFVQGFKDKK